MAKKMGYEDPLYYGTKGGSASTILTNAVDVNYEISVETGSTTSRGDGTTVPVDTGEATSLASKLSFTMIVDDGDSNLVALVAAAKAGTAVALRHKTFDADCILSVTQGSPLKGEATVSFNVEKLSASDRDPSL